MVRRPVDICGRQKSESMCAWLNDAAVVLTNDLHVKLHRPAALPPGGTAVKSGFGDGLEMDCREPG
jgi:hypothetical protein